MAGKLKYLSKSVKFGSTDLTMYSLDGLTWSSQKDELLVLKERQESQRISLEPQKIADKDKKVEGEPSTAVATPVVKPRMKPKYKPRTVESIPLPPGVKKGWTPKENVEISETARKTKKPLISPKAIQLQNKLAIKKKNSETESSIKVIAKDKTSGIVRDNKSLKVVAKNGEVVKSENITSTKQVVAKKKSKKIKFFTSNKLKRAVVSSSDKPKNKKEVSRNSTKAKPEKMRTQKPQKEKAFKKIQRRAPKKTNRIQRASSRPIQVSKSRKQTAKKLKTVGSRKN